MARRAKLPGLQTSTGGDRFATVRKEARKVLELLQKEIRRAEADLHKLVEQARIWEQAIALGDALPAAPGAKRGRRPKVVVDVEGEAPAAPKAPRKPRAAGPRVDWDEVLRSLPEVFGIEDVLKHPGAAAKGKAQSYPAMTRWQKAGRIEKVERGKFRRL
ncbi:MAG: hypothetical protein ACKOCT_22215 [Alphaproteobacteria bacterium]